LWHHAANERVFFFFVTFWGIFFPPFNVHTNLAKGCMAKEFCPPTPGPFAPGNTDRNNTRATGEAEIGGAALQFTWCFLFC
jgi:hypothetical protein